VLPVYGLVIQKYQPCATALGDGTTTTNNNNTDDDDHEEGNLHLLPRRAWLVRLALHNCKDILIDAGPH